MRQVLLRIIVAVVLFLAAGVATFAAIDHYQKTKNNTAPAKTMTDSEAMNLVNQVKETERLKREALTDQFNAQTAECEKGMVAYDKLTPFVQTQTEQPNCALPLEQAL